MSIYASDPNRSFDPFISGHSIHIDNWCTFLDEAFNYFRVRCTRSPPLLLMVSNNAESTIVIKSFWGSRALIDFAIEFWLEFFNLCIKYWYIFYYNWLYWLFHQDLDIILLHYMIIASYWNNFWKINYSESIFLWTKRQY